MGDDDGIGFLEVYFACLSAVAVGYFVLDPQTKNKKAVDNIERIVSAQQPQLHAENVLGGPESETFYVIDGNRLYVTVDGKAVEDYFPLQAEKRTR